MTALREAMAMLVALVVAVAASQVPAFVQQYEQRLGGALQEAQRQLGQFEGNAAAAGLSFNDYLRHLTQSSDPAVARTGDTVAGVARRVAELGAEAQALAAASHLMKPVVLAGRYDPDLLAGAWRQFQLTLLLDPEFAVVGLVLGWLLHRLVWAVLDLARPRQRHRPYER